MGLWDEKDKHKHSFPLCDPNRFLNIIQTVAGKDFALITSAK